MKTTQDITKKRYFQPRWTITARPFFKKNCDVAWVRMGYKPADFIRDAIREHFLKFGIDIACSHEALNERLTELRYPEVVEVAVEPKKYNLTASQIGHVDNILKAPNHGKRSQKR